MDFSAFEAVPGISVVIHPNDPLFTIEAVTNDFVEQLGIGRNELVGRGLFEAFPNPPTHNRNSGEEPIRKSFARVIDHKKRDEIRVLRFDRNLSDGSFAETYWKINNAPILATSGEVLFIIHSSVDITHEVLAQKKIDTSKGIEKAYNFFISAPVIIGFLTGEDYVIELANEGLLEIWGKGSEVIGKPLLQALPELGLQQIISLLNQVRNTGEPFYAYEYPITLIRNGKEEELYFDFIYKPYYETGSNEKASGIISVGHDVTEKVLSRKKIKESEEKYSTLFNAMDQGFCVLELIFDEQDKPVNYKFLEINPVFEKQTGLKDAEGKTVKELVPGLEDHWFQLYGNVSVTGQPVRFTEGSAAMGRWFDVYAFPIGQGHRRNVALLFTDITESRRAEEALRLSESNLRNMILQAPVAMGILKGLSFTVEIANDRLYELWGRGEKELINQPLFDALPEVRHQGFEELLTKVYTTGESYSAYGVPVTVPRGGTVQTVYINFLYEPFREGDASVSGIMVVATDVTNQVQARMKVEESNKELQFAMNAMPQMVWVTKPDGYHEFYNNQWYEYTGLTYEESIDTGWDTVLHEEDKQRSWKVWKHSLQTGDPYEIEYRFKRHDGEYRWFLGRALPLKDEKGNIIKWFGTCTDIDDQKKTAHVMEEMVKDRTRELQLTIQELERSNANLEDFAYAASHDLKEPVRKIRTFSDRLKHHLKERLEEEDLSYFERMDRATLRMQNLIDDLLEYSHVATNNQLAEEIDLNKKINLVLEDLELEIAEKKASIKVSDLPVIFGHRRQIQQLLQNLVTNALKFHKPDLPPEITISSTVVSGNEVDADLIEIAAELKNRTFHRLVISDNGIGFEQKYADKIFKMFQRLHGKAEYDGTGIGLAIARKVVENHRGFITAVGAPGEGATFTVLLPKEE